MTTPRHSVPGHETSGRPIPPPAGANAGDDDSGSDGITVQGGSLYGSDDGALEGVRQRASERAHARDTVRERDAEVPIGSALNAAPDADASTVDAGGDPASGPNTLGAASGGERAVSGRSDARRNSHNDHSQLGGGNLEG